MLSDYIGRADWRSASSRWARMRDMHLASLAAIAAGRSADSDVRERAVSKRVRAMAPTIAAEAGAARAMRLADWLGARSRERIIGAGDFEPAAFLEVGLAVSRAVCFVEVRDRIGASVSRGTGFLVSPEVMVTNHHVIMNSKEAGETTVSLDYRDGPSGEPVSPTRFSLDPGRLFLTDKSLDCTFVAIGPRVSGPRSVGDYPWLPLVGVEGKIEVGEPVNIIQHPRGEPMQFVIRDNRLLLLPELAELRDPKLFAHYEADTLPGSSGAPVLSRMWEVFALHHQAVPAVDADGNILDVDGKPYYGEDEARVKWLGNEGIRVSALVRFLENQLRIAGGVQRDVIASVLAAIRPDYVKVAERAHLEYEKHQPEDKPMPGRIEFTLPLRVSISLDGPPSATATATTSTLTPVATPGPSRSIPSASASEKTAMSPPLQADRGAALASLERSRARKYYDERADEANTAAYYNAINLGDDKAKNFHDLSQLLTTTHVTKPAYRPAVHLYPWVDLQQEGRRLVIKSVYSGQIFDAQEFIEEAFRIEARREALRPSMRTNEVLASMSESMMDELLEANAPFNCEHVVPQSWFGKKEPMRGDLHHLFACESGCNSFRGNHAYFDFPPEEAIRELCGRREEDRFEPGAGKGVVARATFYFLLRYPRKIDLDISQMDGERIATLVRWHKGDPVTVYERHRNQAIFEAQGNRNPFIDHPDWVERVTFEHGL